MSKRLWLPLLSLWLALAGVLPGMESATAYAEDGPAGYTYCADEYGTCVLPGTAVVAYGAQGTYTYGTFTGSVFCDNSVFGDPIGWPKACYYQLTSGSPGAAATPTFSPAGGTYSAAQTVTISSATAGAVIRYTTDGSTPTSSSAVYSTPFSISSTQTVKAIATKSGYADSPVASASYTITSGSSGGGGPAGYTFCANEDQTCSFSGTRSVAYGANGNFAYQTLTGGTTCSNGVFGDPAPGTFKICYVADEETPPPTEGAPIPGRIEAEDYDAMSGVTVGSTTDTGGGFSIGSIDAGDWAEYDVDVETAGRYFVSVRAASMSDARQLQILGNSGTPLQTFIINETGGWDTWTTVRAIVELPAGLQTLRLYAVNEGFNVNWLDFQYITPRPPSTEEPEWAPSTTYSASASFGAVQGYGGWYAMKKEGGTYSSLAEYSSASPARWQEAGGLPYVRDSFFHPDTSADAVKKWIAPVEGNVSIAGTIGRPASGSNGVTARILLNTTELWSGTVTSSADVVPAGVNNIHVRAGDALYFIVGSNGNKDFDETNWSPVITMTNYVKLEAGGYSSLSGASVAATSDAGGGQDIVGFDSGDYVVFGNVNLSGGYKTLEARLSSLATGGRFEVRLDGPNGALASSFTVAGTDGSSIYETQRWAFGGGATGTHDLYVKGVSGSDIARIHWLRLTNEEPRGATVPFRTYEAEAGTAGAGAAANEDSIVKQASSGKSYVNLNATGEYVEWTGVRDANRLVLRYGIPRNTSGTLSLYVNGTKVSSLSLASTFNYDSVEPDTFIRRFDDKAFAVDIDAGDTIRLQKDSGDSLSWYAIDLIDLESAAPPLAKPANAISVKDAPYSAAGDGVADDTAAIQSAIYDALIQGKDVWLPPGTYIQSDRILVPEGVNVRGAGLWHTHLHSVVTTSEWGGKVGFTIENETTVKDMRISGVETSRIGEHAFAIQTVPGTGQNNRLDRLWVEHVGGFVGWTDWDDSVIENVRVTDTYFDAIHWGDKGDTGNLARNNYIRGTGDDGIANVNGTTFPLNENNVAERNTISAVYWGRGMSVVGGSNIIYRDNVIDSTYLAGMIVTTEQLDTPSYPISGFKFQRNTINKAGHTGHNHAGLHFWLSVNPMENVKIELNEIRNGETQGIHIDNTSYGDSGGRTQFNYNTATDNALEEYENASTLIVPVLNGNTGF